jgi:glutathione synthase/RimK-type ligase-like ATP-grasp enzyme
MKIGIHIRPGSFSDRWVKYCVENKVEYKSVNCYSSDILTQLEDCDGLMWHWDLIDYRAALFARQLTFSLLRKGIKVFPDINTAWHYDDKLGQKYLLEAIDAPLVNTYLFYSRHDAIEWIEKTTFPKVFKLRSGAGSVNVKLVPTKENARGLIKKAFGKGFSHFNSFLHFKENIYVLKRDKNYPAFKEAMIGLYRMVIHKEIEKYSQNERGYIYFQDFIEDNLFDTRIVVVGNRCFGIRRYCRKGDFRASGSGILKYEPDLFENNCIKIAFEVAKKLECQSIAFDFVKDREEHKIVEISYCFTMGKAYDNCPGYWDENLIWHEKKVDPQIFMIEDFIESLNKRVL